MDQPGDRPKANEPEDNTLSIAMNGSSQHGLTYLSGSRFWAASVALATLLFLTAVEASIVTTSLVAITDDLGGFESSSWVVSSYLLGYVGL
ncbi:hypothetical protein DL765_000794 [Monosporascus sp. GIB2]|nr:hypothetical protein DL765_000794 [Monosporascus sp. GIB2]